MGHILDEVTRAAANTDTHIRALPNDEVDALKKNLLEKYSNSNRFRWIWEHLKNFVAVSDENAWIWLDEFLNEEPVLMVFNTSDEPAGILLANGRNTAALLAECYLFEFYLTNKATDYLICFNHHDIIYGAGKAAFWLQQKLESSKQEAESYSGTQ